MTSPDGYFNDLPIRDFRSQITDLVDRNQVTIISAETGAGKSTQVPQYLAEHGYTKVIVTQPRILAARNLSRRVREEWAIRTGKDSDNLIGYRTAHERDDGPETKILYCTDGLQLVREIAGDGTSERQVLILDEVHEWNENMEVLVAWAKRRCLEEPRFKIVIMSATIETDSLADYFNSSAVVKVPGRSHEVAWLPGSDLVSEIFGRLNTGSNMLVFLPGKSEIQDVADVLERKASVAGVPVIPLHSQLEASAQQQAFASYPNGKIILATNIAQTSVTIDDIDVVIDSGLARQIEVKNGVEGLFIAQTSQADCQQRAGRAGRTKPGQYVLAQYDTMPCLSYDERPAYAMPEILRQHIDRVTLRLANVGIDIEALDFYHDPSHRAKSQAKRKLIRLGALTGSGDVTRIGRQMEQFPVESSYGRMLVEAKQFSDEAQAKLAAVIAIQEVGGIVKGGIRYTGWKRYTKQTKSDLLAEYDVYLALDQVPEDNYEELGIISKNVAKAEEVMERLLRELGLFDQKLTPISSDQQEYLMRSIVAGRIDQLWMINERGEAVHITTKKRRELSSSTVVRSPRLIAGMPFDLQVPTRGGDLETLHLVQDVTAVDTTWLLELAPDLFSARRGKLYYDPRLESLASRQLVRFGGRALEGQSQPVSESTATNRRAFISGFAAWAHAQLERQRRELGRRYSGKLPQMSIRSLEQQVKNLVEGATALDQLDPEVRRSLLDLAKLELHFGDDFIDRLGPEKRRGFRSWKPKHKRGWQTDGKPKYKRRNK